MACGCRRKTLTCTGKEHYQLILDTSEIEMLMVKIKTQAIEGGFSFFKREKKITFLAGPAQHVCVWNATS